MKIIVLFYSYEGNTELIAREIVQEIGAEQWRLRPREEKHYSGVMKYVWNGKAALMREKPELELIEKDILGYDLIFLGTPVWAGNWAPVFNTLFDRWDFGGKRIACFYCHAGAPGSIEKRFRRKLSTASLLGFCDFVDPLWSRNSEEQKQKARKWAREMMFLVSQDKR